MSVDRRKLIVLLLSNASLLALTGPARAQAALLSKIPWKVVIEGFAGIVTLCEILIKIFWTEKPATAAEAPQPLIENKSDKSAEKSEMRSQEPICRFSIADITEIYNLCLDVGLEVNSLEFERSIAVGNGGLLPIMKSYVERPNKSNWNRLRQSALNFLKSSGFLFNQLDKQDSIVKLVEPGKQAELILQFRNALKVSRMGVQIIHFESKRTSSEFDVDAVKELIPQFEIIPSLIDRTQFLLSDLLKKRSEVSCFVKAH